MKPELENGIAEIQNRVEKLERSLAPRLCKFVAVGRIVMSGKDAWARARSHTFAKRIANALNAYGANNKGV